GRGGIAPAGVARSPSGRDNSRGPDPVFPAYTGVPAMTFFARGIAVLALAAALVGTAGSALAQAKPALDSERDKVSYMIGMDVGRSIEAAGPDVDLKAFERALRNALDGGEPLVPENEVQALAQSLMARIASRAGKLPAGTPVPEVARDKVGFLVGADVGRQLSTIADEIEVPM